MAIDWECWQCKTRVTGSSSRYGSLCNECDGTNARKRQEVERWASLSLEQKCDELKARLDAMGPAIRAASMHIPIG